jgi:predicted Zn-dependent peptidase
MTPTYHQTTLPNGLRVVTTPMPAMYSMSVVVMLGVGSRFETDAQAGSSHLLEHMLFKGTVRRPAARIISEAIERTGGVLDASTGKEETACSARVAGADAALAIDLLADMILDSLIDPAEVAKEKQVIIEELGMALDSPQEWVHTLLDEILWPGHPLGRDVAGTRESVAGLDRASLIAFRAGHYAPANTVVSLAGNIDEGALLAATARHFATWPPRGPLWGSPGGIPSPPLAAPSPAGGPRLRIDRRDTEQVNLCVAAGGVDHHDPDRYAFDVLTSLIGGGVSSRLFLEVRERRGLVYDIHSYGQRFADTGAFVTYAGVDPENAVEVVAEIVRQIDRVRAEAVPDDELERFKQSYRGRLLLGLEDTYSVAAWYGGQVLLRGAIQSPEEVMAAVEGITAEQVQKVARRLFTTASLRLAAIGPLDDEDEKALEETLQGER